MIWYDMCYVGDLIAIACILLSLCTIVPLLNFGTTTRLSSYTSNPSDAHWKAMIMLLHYLRYSRNYGLQYDRYPVVIEEYNDANWISEIKDSRLTSGYVFTLGGEAIYWKSSKQIVISKSMMES
ncbi:hypothetical protein Tco_0277702 [Tanacetum coccineum]